MKTSALFLALTVLLVTPVLAQNWIPITNGLISNTITPAGREANGTPIYIARATFQGGQHIGKARPGDRAAAISYGGLEHWVTPYEVYAAPGGFWAEVLPGRPLPGPMILGAVEANGARQFIGRAAIAGGIHPGKVIGNRIWVPYGGREVSPTSFSVLVTD